MLAADVTRFLDVLNSLPPSRTYLRSGMIGLRSAGADAPKPVQTVGPAPPPGLGAILEGLRRKVKQTASLPKTASIVFSTVPKVYHLAHLDTKAGAIAGHRDQRKLLKTLAETHGNRTHPRYRSRHRTTVLKTARGTSP